MRYIEFVFVALTIGLCENAVIPNAFLAPDKRINTTPGLYDANDKVVVLNGANLYEKVFNQDHATEVEFYNSFCGFCKRFAPIFKKYAADLADWKEVIVIAAIDCAAEENNDRCREFEIMSYPSIRYFPPGYKPGDKQFGINVEHVPMETGHGSLIGLLMNETNAPSTWPRLKPLPLLDRHQFFDDEHDDVQFMFILNDLQKNSTTAQDVALDFHKTKKVSVRQVVSVEVANRLNLPVHNGLFVIHRGSVDAPHKIDVATLNRESVVAAITEYINAQHVRLENIPHVEASEEPPAEKKVTSVDDEMQEMQNKAIIEHVLGNPGHIYRADIEAAIKYAVFHELTQIKTFDAESLLAAQQFIRVLQK